MTTPSGPSDFLAAILGTKPAVSSSSSEKQPYRAFKPGEGGKRYLEFRVKFPEPSIFVPNNQLTNLWNDWRLEELIVLAYSGKMVVTIRGERLGQLAQAISDWTVEWLTEFDPMMHEPVQGENEPFIRSITIQTTRPEEPPEPSKRH